MLLNRNYCCLFRVPYTSCLANTATSAFKDSWNHSGSDCMDPADSHWCHQPSDRERIRHAAERLLSEDLPPDTLALLQLLSVDDDLLYDVLQLLLDGNVIEALGDRERTRLNQRLSQVSEWRGRRMQAAADAAAEAANEAATGVAAEAAAGAATTAVEGGWWEATSRRHYDTSLPARAAVMLRRREADGAEGGAALPGTLTLPGTLIQRERGLGDGRQREPQAVTGTASSSSVTVQQAGDQSVPDAPGRARWMTEGGIPGTRGATTVTARGSLNATAAGNLVSRRHSDASMVGLRHSRDWYHPRYDAPVAPATTSRGGYGATVSLSDHQCGRGAGEASAAQQVELQLQSVGNPAGVIHGAGGGPHSMAGNRGDIQAGRHDAHHDAAGNWSRGGAGSNTVRSNGPHPPTQRDSRNSRHDDVSGNGLGGSGDRATISLGGGAGEELAAASTATTTIAADTAAAAAFRNAAGVDYSHCVEGTVAATGQTCSTVSGSHRDVQHPSRQGLRTGSRDAASSGSPMEPNWEGDDGASDMAVATAILVEYQARELSGATTGEHHSVLRLVALGEGDATATMHQTGTPRMRTPGFLPVVCQAGVDLLQATPMVMQQQQLGFPSLSSYPPYSRVVEMRGTTCEEVQMEFATNSTHERLTSGTQGMGTASFMTNRRSPTARFSPRDHVGKINNPQSSGEEHVGDTNGGTNDDFRLFGVDMRPQR